jgi:[Skp1-protein]-hydroxyproline N-acetylglucosaminyltransferase
MINIILLLLILILIIYIFCIKQENFDETKIKIKEFADLKIKEFNYENYRPLIEKYFKELELINLKTIKVSNDKKIFCSVASYRDKQCPLTVKDMILKAKNPENLVICICQQNDGNDESCFDKYDLKGATIKSIILSDRDARGPCWARYLIQQAWTGEEYFLQIDSHMRFVQDWDEKCKNDIKSLPEKSCLTNYVSNFNLETGMPDEHNQLRGPLKIVNKETSEYDGFFRVNSDFITSSNGPMLAYGWGACFSFSKSNILHDAPYDPYTPFLFFGEEMDIWARMYTHGWYVYAPSVPICFTNFDRAYRPTFWENPDQASTEFLCRLRLYYRFKYLNDIPHELKIGLEDYNLGNEKTWEQFLTFCLDELPRT